MSKMLLNHLELRILAEFAQDYSRTTYGRAIAKKIGMSQRTVANILNVLEKEGFLKYTREGKNKLYFIDKESPMCFQIIMLIESYKAVNFLMNNPRIAITLKDVLNCGAIIFGSYAKNNPDKESDVDIVFLSKENKKIKEILGNSPIKFHVQFSTMSDFKKKLKEKNPLASEIAQNHIILGNFEEVIKIFMAHYYEAK